MAQDHAGDRRLGRGRLPQHLLRAQFVRLKTRRGPKKAVVAVAASILTAAYHILRDGVAYCDLGGDYFDRRDRSSVVRRLSRRIESLGYHVEVHRVA